MSTIYKCDKCKKTITRNKSVNLSVSDTNGLIGPNSFYTSYDLCEKCAKKDSKFLQKIFPDLILKKDICP
jgi:hypothetical protein